MLADQPLTASRRRQLLLNFLQAKLEADDEQLLLEGARVSQRVPAGRQACANTVPLLPPGLPHDCQLGHRPACAVVSARQTALSAQGMWELSINKPHHAELEQHHLQPLVRHLQCPNVEVSRLCAAAVWGFAVNERCRALLVQLDAVRALLSLARQSLVMPCLGDTEALPQDCMAGGKCSQTQRNQLQACVLGALTVLVVDRACREPLVDQEPGCGTLFEMCHDLVGYEDGVWAAARRTTAANALASMVQRDQVVRLNLVLMGGIPRILELLQARVSMAHRLHAIAGRVTRTSAAACHAAVLRYAGRIPQRLPRALGMGVCSCAWPRFWPRWCWMMRRWQS